MLSIEILIIVIAPYPFCDEIEYWEYNEEFNYHIKYNLNDALLFFSFNRSYILGRYVLVHT